MHRNIVWCLSALAITLTACDGVFNVRGQITTSTGAPIPNVEIIAYDGNARATTDARGCFDLVKVCSPRSHETQVFAKIDGRRVDLATLNAPAQKLVRFAIAVKGDQTTVSAAPMADLGPCR